MKTSLNKLFLVIAIGFIGSSILTISHPSLAHEGHDNAPGTLKANHGGTVKPGKQINLEFLSTENEVKLYPLSHDGKDLNATEVKLTATTKLPKGKPQAATLEYKDGAFHTKVDFKEAFRVELTVTSTYNGKTDTFKFQVEK